MSQCQIFSADEIASLRRAGKILHDCLEHVAALVKPGITTIELDEAAETFIRSHEGAVPAFKGYNGYKHTLCTSVNDECVHGIPGKRELKEGDIISLDCGVIVDALYTDACITVAVGKITPEAQHLLSVTEEALKRALSVVHEGCRTGDISGTVEEYVKSQGCLPVRALTGHGLGTTLHQFPEVPNFGTKGTGPKLPAGTIVAIEPIVTSGKSDAIATAGDGWTITIKHGSLAAHFEHTVLITQSGCEILT